HHVEHATDRRIVHADVDIVADPGLLPAQQRHQYARESLHAGENVRDRYPWYRGLSVFAQCNAEQAALGLERKIVRRPVAEWALLPKRADRAVDDARIARSNRVVIDTKALDHARPKRLDDDVSGLAEPEQRLALAWLLEVEHDTLLATVHILEEHAGRAV